MKRARDVCDKYLEDGGNTFMTTVVEPILLKHRGKQKLLAMFEVEFGESVLQAVKRVIHNKNAKH